MFNSCYHSTKIRAECKNKTYYYCSKFRKSLGYLAIKKKTHFLTHLNFPFILGASSDRSLSGKNKKLIQSIFVIICISNIYELGIERQSLYADSRTISRNKRNQRQNDNNNGGNKKKPQNKPGRENNVEKGEDKAKGKGSVKGKKGKKNLKRRRNNGKNNENGENDENEETENKKEKQKKQRKLKKTKKVKKPEQTRTLTRQVDDTCVKVNFY